MCQKSTILRAPYWGAILFSVVVWTGSLTGTVKAEKFVFQSGDETCAQGDCVRVNTTTTYQPGWPQPEPGVTGSNTPLNVTVLDKSGGPSAFLSPHQVWYQPGDANPIITGSQSLNAFLTEAAGSPQAARWVSYTSSGVRNDGQPHPDLPAVPNYCRTSSGGGGGGNLNPSGNPGCDPNVFDARSNQARGPQPNNAVNSNLGPAADNQRIIGNQTAKFSEQVTLPAIAFEHYRLEFYVWTDDTTLVEVLGPNNTHIAMSPANPYPALSTTGYNCAAPDNFVACAPAAGGKFTASGLDGSGGTYTFNFYSFQVGSDVFGTLWGGVFVTTPEPSAILLFGSGLAGLGLLRRLKKD